MLVQLQDLAFSFAAIQMQYQLAAITEELKEVELQHRKQASIKYFFSTKFSVQVDIYKLYL